MSENGKEAPGTEVEAISPETIEKFRAIVAALPQPEGSADDRIVSMLLDAASWEELDAPWQTTDLERLLGHDLRIESVSAMPSAFADGLGFFLVVNSYDMESGEELTWTTGSVSVVAQLAKAAHAGWLPLRAQLVQAERPTRRGYYPQHLVITDRFGDV